MRGRKLAVFLTPVLLVILLCCNSNADSNVNGLEREVDNDKSIGQVLSDFFSSLLNLGRESRDTDSNQTNASSQAGLDQLISGLSGPPANNSTRTDTLSKPPGEVTTQNSQPSSKKTTVEAMTSPTQFLTTSSTWSETSSTSYFVSKEDKQCYTDAVLQNFCPVSKDMIDVSFWDLYSVIFSDTVLDALQIGCSKGSWCLQDRFDYWEALIVERVDMVTESEISTGMCQPEVDSCIDKVVQSFVNCSVHPQMTYTQEALRLLCGLKKNPRLDESCYKHVITALHVTLADIIRTQENEEESVADDICLSPEAHMTKGLICVTNSCPGESDTFNNFQPWKWFTKVVDEMISECDLDPTKCLALLQPPPGYLYGNEVGTMVGLSIATLLTALLFSVGVCTCYKRYRRNVVLKDGYQQLLNDGDES